MNNNRFIVEPGVHHYTKRRCFIVRDTDRSKYEKFAGVNAPLRTKEEAEYLAWVLNNKHSRDTKEKQSSH